MFGLLIHMNVKQFPTEVTKALAWPFDFDIKRVSRGAVSRGVFEFTISPPVKLIPLAGDGAGGVYAQLMDRGDILFVDSEGAGGVIAPDLEGLILLFVCHPYWRDLLKFSGGGRLAEMRRTLPYAERDYYEDEPEARVLGAMIRRKLDLPDVADVVGVLHASVASTSKRLTLTGSDGCKYDSLFRQFTANSNPAWRRA